MEEEIKCHLCGEKAKLCFEDLKLDNGKIIVMGAPYYKCPKCKEEFATSGQMQELSDRINSRFSFQRPVIAAGRSLAVTLPADIVQYYNIKKGSKIRIIPENRKELRIAIG